MISSIGFKLSRLKARDKLTVLLVCDGLALPLCAAAAVLLASGGMPEHHPDAAALYLLVGLATQAVLFYTGLYRSVVRFIDLRAVTRTALGLAIVLLLLYALLLAAPGDPVPLTAPTIYGFVAFTYLMTSRFVGRSILLSGLRRGGRSGHRTLIYGAGSAGVQLARAMSFSPDYEAVCFVDDDAALRNKIVSGLQVYGPDDIARAAARHDIDQIVVAIPSAPVSVRQQMIRRLESLGLPVKTLPGVINLVDGQAHISAIRDVEVADLLGRDPVPPDPALFARNLRGKVVLVTGAGGSIGGELCRQILSQQPRRLVMLDHSEIALYHIEQEIESTGTEVIAALGSVLDEDLLRRLLREHEVQTVYHAAAYKHVPIVEANIRQGVVNNVLGTLALARACRQCRVETCILVSTDKAVRPTNIMGATKRIAELIFQAAASEGGATVFSMVRFGNVLGSSGSVVPLFKRQIRDGGPVTITHPDIIRYFMLIPEAAQLVIQAGAMSKGGEVFVLDMGEPVRIADLARRMIRLSGLSERSPEHPDGDIEIHYVGLRPGEKLYEELLIGDNAVPSGHSRILCAIEHHVEPMLLDKMLVALRQACDAGDTEALLRQVRNLVPDYRPPQELDRAIPRSAGAGRDVHGADL